LDQLKARIRGLEADLANKDNLFKMALDSKDKEIERLAAQNDDLIADLKNARDDLKKLRADLTASFQKIIDELKLRIKELEDLLK